MEMMEARALPPLLVLLMQTCARPAHAYKPVIIVHGLFDGPEQFRTLTQFIQKAHPGTPVFPLRVDSRGRSLRRMWLQVQDFRTEALRVMRAHPDGVHLLCFSQGGLVCRGLLATVPNHNVNTFIGLSAPLAGQFGVTDYLKPLLGKRSDVFRFCYSRLGQAVSICDYWNDPHHRDLFLKHNGFLPLLNADVPHSRAAEWRENFLLLKKLVLIGGPDDGVITPWQSSLFGFYDSSEQVVEMRNQTFFLSDAFGLKTLWARGGVQTCVHNGVRHTEWHSNLTVFQSCMERWLT
ncbi:lysosomal thioesterase PPT2-like [Menidia menidia]